jgi:hypothetical protein
MNTSNPYTQSPTHSSTRGATAPIATKKDPLTPTLTKNNGDFLEEPKQRLVKLGQAQAFLEDLNQRLFWAMDFGDCPEINDGLSHISEAISNVQEELDEKCDNIYDLVEQYEEKKEECLKNLAKEFEEDLSYLE